VGRESATSRGRRGLMGHAPMAQNGTLVTSGVQGALRGEPRPGPGGSVTSAGGCPGWTGRWPLEGRGDAIDAGGDPVETGEPPAEGRGSPADGGGDPTERCGDPASASGSPIERCGRPAERGETPVEGCGAPAGAGEPPVEDSGAPAATRSDPVEVQGSPAGAREDPAKVAESPVDARGGSDVLRSSQGHGFVGGPMIGPRPDGPAVRSTGAVETAATSDADVRKSGFRPTSTG
jgi:hypothetical protein